MNDTDYRVNDNLLIFKWDIFTSKEFHEYKSIRLMLKDLVHSFYWENTGKYLPTGVYIKDKEVLLFFKLKFG